MRIKKVKFSSDEKIHLSYEVKSTSGKISEFTLVSSEKAAPSFYQTLQKLRNSVLELCELPSNEESKIHVSGVSFSFAGDNDTMGAVITAQRRLSNSNAPLNLNTPHKAVEPYGDGKADAKQLLPDECIDVLNGLIDEAEAYIEGKREQTDLFDKENQ